MRASRWSLLGLSLVALLLVLAAGPTAGTAFGGQSPISPAILADDATPGPTLVPPSPRLKDQIKRGEVTLPEFLRNAETKLDRGIDQPIGRAPGKGAAGTSRATPKAMPSTGTQNVLALLVQFPDKSSNPSLDSFNQLLFANGTGATSLRSYYSAVSHTKFDLVTVNAPDSWLTMPQSYGTYAGTQTGLGTYPNNAQKLAEDAVIAASNAGVDFSPYDNNKDGVVDTVIIVHAGCGAEWGGDCSSDIWSHSWSTSYDVPVNGGKVVQPYITMPEYWGNSQPSPMTIGVFAHEFGHALGLPDLYDTDSTGEGIGRWSLMAYGSWNGPNGDGASPAFLDAWSRSQLKWVAPTPAKRGSVATTFPAVETQDVVYRLQPAGAPSTEYFLVENRQLSGYDASLPAAGLLIWHVDDTLYRTRYGLAPLDNNKECLNRDNWRCGTAHYRVALEQADGAFGLERTSYGDSTDPYPTASNATFTFNTRVGPTSSSYASRNDTKVGVTSIKATKSSGGSVTATLVAP